MATQPIPTFDEFVQSSAPAPGLTPLPQAVSARIVPGSEQLAPPEQVPSFDDFDKTEVNHSLLKEFGTATIDQLIGMAKGAGSTVFGINKMFRDYVPGIAWLGNKISDFTLGGHISEEEFAKGRETLGLKPTNLAQKIGFNAEQIGEFFVPGAAISKTQKLAQAGTRFAAAFPKLAKAAPVAEYGSRGALEAIPAVAIGKAQGQDNAGGTAFFAMAGPTFGKLLNKTGASGLATGAAKGVVGKVSKQIAEKIPEVPQSPRQMMWRALKPFVRNRDFDKSLDNAMPELFTQSRMLNQTVENVDDFLGLLKATKKRIWAPYQKFLGETAATIDGNDVAAAIRGAIAPRQVAMATTRNSKGLDVISGGLKKIYNWADHYKHKKMPLSEAEDYLQNVNAQIQGYYAKYPSARHAAMEANPSMAAAVKEAEALRAAINQQISTAHPKVKEVYGALSNLEQEAYRRVNVSKRLAPESLTEQMSKVHAAGEFAWGVARGHPLEAVAALAKGRAYVQASKIIKERNTSDYLIKKAFSDFGEYVDKAKKAHRIPTALTGAAQKDSAKITEPTQTKPFNMSQSVATTTPPPPKFTQYNEKPLYETRKAETFSIPKAESPNIKSLEPKIKAMVDETVEMRMREAKEVYQSGLGELSGKGKKIEGINDMNYRAATEEKAGFGKIRVKSAIPELADFKESPGRIAEAIERDKDNPLYLRVKKAVEEATIENNADKIEELRLARIVKSRKKATKNKFNDVPF
jgi:hypothetical protein